MWSPTCLPLLIITMQELRMAENIITTTFNSVTQTVRQRTGTLSRMSLVLYITYCIIVVILHKK